MAGSIRLSALLLAALASFTLLAAVVAEPETGSFFKYRYEIASSEGGSLTGTLMVTVVEKISAEMLRLRYEATFNDGLATLEKNLPSRLFAPPMVDFASLEGDYQITKDGGNITYRLSVEKTGENRRTVGGTSYQTNVYRLTATAKHGPSTVSLEGTAETIAESDVIYLLSLSLSDGERRVDYRLVLSESNVDLTQFRLDENGSPVSSSLTSMFAGMPVDGRVFARFDAFPIFSPDRGVQAGVVEEKEAADQTERVALLGVVGVVTFIGVGLAAYRLGRGAVKSGERKAHYV
ncbi:MAG: hypothetical protein NZ921_04505 [Candidatus Caldarchaeum sp.]|nr:hypothetical protein [Candidatus Caldarchaeum sp.]